LSDNQTPAEATDIDLMLDKQNPMKDLIVKSAIASQKEKNPEMYVVNQLGKRFEKLTVINKKDCIKPKQKAWIEREELTER
jgi:glucose dehydrogenase